MKNACRFSIFAATLAAGIAFQPTFTSTIAFAEQYPIPTPVVVTAAVPKKITTPYVLTIPQINLETPVVAVGLNAKGEMDVPSGKTNNVGWYKAGTKPGDIGSAVLDAHVFAAFKKLTKVAVGDSLYIESASGKKLHFVVQKTEVTPLAQTSTQKLFMQHDAARLNLITCAGTYNPILGTYDHRLIVYAVLVS
jgi:sortase A